MYNQEGNINSLEGKHLKSVKKFTYLGSNIASTSRDIEIRKAKVWSVSKGVTIIMEIFFRTVVESVLLLLFHYMDFHENPRNLSEWRIYTDAVGSTKDILKGTP